MPRRVRRPGGASVRIRLRSDFRALFQGLLPSALSEVVHDQSEDQEAAAGDELPEGVDLYDLQSVVEAVDEQQGYEDGGKRQESRSVIGSIYAAWR